MLLREVLAALGHRPGHGFALVDLDLAAASNTTVGKSWYGLDHPDPARRDALTSSWRHPGVRYLNMPYGRMCRTCPDSVWKGKRERERLGLTLAQLCPTLRHESVDMGDWMGLCTMAGADPASGPLVAFPAARTSEKWFQSTLFGSERNSDGRRIFEPDRAGPARAVYVDGRVRFLDPETLVQAPGGSPVGNVFLEWLPPASETGRWVLQTGTIRNDGSGANVPAPVWREDR